jgi:hypothetical protein
LYIVSYCIIFVFIVHCIPLYIVSYCWYCILYLIVYCILFLFILSIVSYRFNLLYHIVLRPYLALQNLKSVHVFTGLRQDGSHQSRGFKGDATASGLFRAQTRDCPGLWQAAWPWPPLSRSESVTVSLAGRALRHLWLPPVGLSAGRFEAQACRRWGLP